MSADDKEWVCRIPDSLLQGLAASRALGRRTQVVSALLAKLFNNLEKDQGIATASLSYLARKTGLDVRTVRLVLSDLYQAGVLHDVEAQAGRSKVLQLSPAPNPSPLRGNGPWTENAQGDKSAHSPRQKRAGSGTKARTVPCAESAHPIYKKKNSSKNLFTNSRLERVDLAPSSNGQNPFHTLGVDRRARIHRMLTDTVKSSRGLKEPAMQRWLQHIEQLTPDLAACADLSESTLRRRAREFFIREWWVNLGDSSQAESLRWHLLKPVKKAKAKAPRLREQAEREPANGGISAALLDDAAVIEGMTGDVDDEVLE